MCSGTDSTKIEWNKERQDVRIPWNTQTVFCRVCKENDGGQRNWTLWEGGKEWTLWEGAKEWTEQGHFPIVMNK